MAEDIYEPSVPYLQVKMVRHKVQHVEPTIVTNTPKGILDSYNNINLCFNLIRINSTGFLNTISQNIIFAMVSMIKNRKLKNIEDGIKKVDKLYDLGHQ